MFFPLKTPLERCRDVQRLPAVSDRPSKNAVHTVSKQLAETLRNGQWPATVPQWTHFTEEAALVGAPSHRTTVAITPLVGKGISVECSIMFYHVLIVSELFYPSLNVSCPTRIRSIAFISLFWVGSSISPLKKGLRSDLSSSTLAIIGSR